MSDIFSFGGERTPPLSGSSADSAARTSIHHLESRIERAMLTMQALWTLVQDRLQLTEEDLKQRILEVDMTDGVLDGKVRRPPAECGHCSRKVPQRLATCMYCGAVVDRDPFA